MVSGRDLKVIFIVFSLIAGVIGVQLYYSPYVLIQGPTKLLSTRNLAQVKEILQPGEKGKLLCARRSKDYEYYWIILPDGRLGYIKEGGEFTFLYPYDYERPKK